MALVTVRAVVHIAVNLLVMEVGRVIAAVAARALEHRIVIRVRVARGADVVGVAVACRELRVLRVIERRAGPSCRVMAVLACRWEELRLRLVARIGCVVVIRLVASVARRGQRGVVAIDMAIGTYARRHGVRAGQRECGVVVVEGRICPDGCVVAQFAGGRESRRSMRGVGCTRIVLLVARVAERAVE